MNENINGRVAAAAKEGFKFSILTNFHKTEFLKACFNPEKAGPTRFGPRRQVTSARLYVCFANRPTQFSLQKT